MRIRWWLWNNGDRNCATTRHRGWNIIDELRRRDVDAGPYADGETADAIIVQRMAPVAVATRLRQRAGELWLDVNDDYIGAGREYMGFPDATLAEYDGLLVCSNRLRDKLSRLHDNVRLWPEAIDPIYLTRRCEYTDRRNDVRIAWMGGTDNLGWFALSPIRWALPEIAKHFRLTWVIAMPPRTCVGQRNETLARALLPSEVEFHAWEYGTVAKHMASCDLSVIPLEQTDWCWCKSDNKAASLMALGLPVAVEDAQCYHELVRRDETGLLCYYAEEWGRNITRLIAMPDLRRGLGENGRAEALRLRSAGVIATRLLEVLGDDS